MNITDYIGIGKDKAVTRTELCSQLGMTDRTVRKMIELARAEGALIINAQDGRGYYISEDEADIRRQLNINHSRAMSILRQQKKLRQKLREIGCAGQLTIEDQEGESG